jgi:hypothetical protein
LTLAIKKNIVKLDVSMKNALRVKVAKALNDLLKEILGDVLIKLLPLSHIV